MLIALHKFVKIVMQKFENDNDMLSKFETIKIFNNISATFIIRIR